MHGPSRVDDLAGGSNAARRVPCRLLGILYLALRAGDAEDKRLPARGAVLSLAIFAGAVGGWEMLSLCLEGTPSPARFLATAGGQVAVWAALKALLRYRKRKLAAAGVDIYPWKQIAKAAAQ